jgi:hypothetical protein
LIENTVEGHRFARTELHRKCLVTQGADT